MKEDQYNKIARLFQFIHNDNPNINYKYGGFEGNYKNYPIDEIQFPDDTMQLITELEKIIIEKQTEANSYLDQIKKLKDKSHHGG